MANAASVLAAASRSDLPPEQLVYGATRTMSEIRARVDKLARTNIPLLIRGESGTGKEVLAELIHQKSQYSIGPFVKVTCSAISAMPFEATRFESEDRSVKDTEPADSNDGEPNLPATLFFDEIGDLSSALQAKLLQVFQDGQFGPLLGRNLDNVDVRIICATNRDLEEAMKNGSFRTDLFYRINVASIDLVPLHKRAADVPILAEYFLGLYATKFNCQPRPISPETMRCLEESSWPGNIRELENLIKRYVILGSEMAIYDGLAESGVRQLAPEDCEDDGTLSLKRITKQASQEIEREIILRALAQNGWNRRQTARVLNISYRALLYKLKNVGVPGARALARAVRQ
jgi:two-component system, NtrC family, response regulator AtoC